MRQGSTGNVYKEKVGRESREEEEVFVRQSTTVIIVL